ncbi:MAG: hypothetical protein GX591_04320 [Planctomycetes bacterium]|nr:hypothetical protein [Planctomycetota bacterium]
MPLRDHYLTVLRQGFVPIWVADGFDAVLLAEAAVAAGAGAVEITCRRSTVRDDIRRVRRRFPELTVLAGSLVDDGPLFDHLRRRRPDMPSIAELADLGVHGLVSAMPLSEATLARYAATHLLMPGVETLADAVRALEAGAHFAKFFTASATGEAARVRTLTSAPTHGLLPVFVTGGVTLATVAPYVAAGAALLGSGWDVLLGPCYQQLQAKSDLTTISLALRAFLDASRDARRAHNAPMLHPDDATLLAQVPFHHPFPAG